MKMLLAIINADDARTVIRALTQEGFSITKLATTGGFLRAGNVTVLIGLPDEQVDRAFEIIRTHSSSRKKMIPRTSEVSVDFYTTTALEVEVGGATVFVMNVERFEKL